MYLDVFFCSCLTTCNINMATIHRCFIFIDFVLFITFNNFTKKCSRVNNLFYTTNLEKLSPTVRQFCFAIQSCFRGRYIFNNQHLFLSVVRFLHLPPFSLEYFINVNRSQTHLHALITVFAFTFIFKIIHCATGRCGATLGGKSLHQPRHGSRQCNVVSRPINAIDLISDTTNRMSINLVRHRTMQMPVSSRYRFLEY